MVRLKEVVLKKILRVLKISIPYGAIKSRIWEFARRCSNRISIPYGAIKSISGIHGHFILLEFQFLMVRLKVKMLF